MSKPITLSSFSVTDKKWLSELLIDHDVRKFLPHLTTDVDTFAHDMEIAELKGLGRFWIIRLDGVGIGFISIYDLTESPFIFYAMLPAYRNKGYMKKALKMIEKSNIPSLTTQINTDNMASLRAIVSTDINVAVSLT